MFDQLRGLIDPDTPAEVMERMSADGKTKMKLVFSDEFETPGRSFFPGDDPFWVSGVMPEIMDDWDWMSWRFFRLYDQCVTRADMSCLTRKQTGA